VEHDAAGAYDPSSADLDGDGFADLIYRTVSPGNPTSQRVQLHAARGGPAEPWRRLGVWTPAADLDGDGTTDLVCGQDVAQPAAISGRDGRPLWEAARVEPAPFGTRGDGNRLQPPGRPGDLDGDGVPDLLCFPEGSRRWSLGGDRTAPIPFPLQALSGRTGRRLWQAPDLDQLGTGISSGYDIRPWILAAQGHDLDGDGRLEVLVFYTLHMFAREEYWSEFWVGVLSAEGRWLWRVDPMALIDPIHDSSEEPLDEAQQMKIIRQLEQALPPAAIADLNGDGVKDIVGLSPPHWVVLRSSLSVTRGSVIVRDGRDGGPLRVPEPGLAAELWPRRDFELGITG
jgi:hypothetical protein